MTTPATARRFLPGLLLLFAASGCSALIYEIVWFQLLQLEIGSSAVSLGVLLGTFMGGMCLGSVALPRLIAAKHHPLRVYALLEAALGILGIAVLFGMPLVDRIYTQTVGHGLPGILLRGLVCAVCLLLPTVFMGATLPAIARWIETTQEGVSWLGLFYGGNIAGAVLGSLLAGFYLLRVHDMATATYVAASLNGVVFLLSLGLARFTIYHPSVAPGPSSAAAPRGAWSVYLTIALSGATALAAEVIWTRLLSLMLGATVYTFSIILAVFLVGLGIGSSVGALLARTSPRPRFLLGCTQVLLIATIAWAAYMLACSLPYWPINPNLSRSHWFSFQLDLLRCLWAVLPAACLWGASFPLALAASASAGQDPGRLVGSVYAANTIGAILGAISASVFLVRGLGTQKAQQVLIALAAVAAFLMLVPYFWSLRQAALPRRGVGRRFLQMGGAFLVLTCIGGAAVLLAWSTPATPWQVVAFGRFLPTTTVTEWKLLYLGEGMNSSVAVTELGSGVRNFHVSGKIEASSDHQDMRLQRMLGHLPALFHNKPRSVLIVGFGAGVTSGSFVTYPEIEKITICEIEPLIPQRVASFFEKENYDVVHDPRVEIVYDDARHYVLTTPQQFDIITSDPIHPWVKGSATLYTREYFEMCKRHLRPGGMVTQWVPLYESSWDVVKSEIATFFEVFPNGTIWSNDQNGHGYDLVLLGQAEPLTLDADELHLRLNHPEHEKVLKSLEKVGFNTVVGLLNTYAGRASELHPWLENAEINLDRNLRLQYLAGLELNQNESSAIHYAMISYRRFPENFFVGTGWRSQALRTALERSISTQHEVPQELGSSGN